MSYNKVEKGELRITIEQMKGILKKSKKEFRNREYECTHTPIFLVPIINEMPEYSDNWEIDE